MSVGERMKKKMQKKKTLTIIGLLMPLVIAIAWLVFILATDKTLVLSGGVQLAPIRDTKPLITGLIIFISGYLLFMILMFAEDIKGMFLHKMHIKHSKK